MKLYIKQKAFSWRTRFNIYDEYEKDKYSVEGEVFTLGKKLHLYASNGKELAYIHQRIEAMLPKYYINCNGTEIAQVMKKVTFFRQEYFVEGLGWSVVGDFWPHEYRINSRHGVIATISRHLSVGGDTYEIDITDGGDEIMVLAVVLSIDAIIDEQNYNH